MITKLSQKYKESKGWLGKKFNDIRHQGSKLVNSNTFKVGAALVGTGVAVGTALQQKEKNTRFDTERRIDEASRRNPDEVGFTQTSPSISEFFANPQDMHPDDRKALGYKNGDSGSNFNYVFSE